MSPESFTNALLIALIGLIGVVSKIVLAKFNEILKDLKTLMTSSTAHNYDIVQIKKDLIDIEKRVDAIEFSANHKAY